MNKKILKTSAALALGLALLAPSANKVYASSTTPSATDQTSIEKAKKDYEKTLADAKAKLTELETLKKAPAYINASDDQLRVDFDSKIVFLKDKISGIEAIENKDEQTYKNSAYTINQALIAANTAANKLDGQKVDVTELKKLADNKLTFQTSADYVNASGTLRGNYDKAVAAAEDAVKNTNISSVDYNKTLTNLKSAIDAIERPINTAAALEALKSEIQEAQKLVKSEYTEKSYRTFNTALVGAKSTAEAPNSNLESIQAARNTLKEAKDSLVKKPDQNMEQLIANLEDALKRSEIRAEAAQLLIDKTPKTVKEIKPDLEKLIAESKQLAKDARAQIAKYRNIKG